jgi:CRP-like cAMP-binding protein
MIAAAIINNVLLSLFSVYAEELSRKATALQKKMDVSNTAMQNLALPGHLRKTVLLYIKNTHNTQLKQSELKDFMDTISPSFKLKVRICIFKDLGKQNFIFSALIEDKIRNNKSLMTAADVEQQSITNLVRQMDIKLTMPEEEIVKQEDPGDPEIEEGQPREGEASNPNMFFIAKGSCEVVVKTSYDQSSTADDESE